MIPMAKELRKLVFENANEDEIRQAAIKNGMVTLRDAGNERVLDGTTSIEEILRSTREKVSLTKVPTETGGPLSSPEVRSRTHL